MNAVEESIHNNHINVLKVVFPHLRVFVSLVVGEEEWREVGRRGVEGDGEKGRRGERRGGEEEGEERMRRRECKREERWRSKKRVGEKEKGGKAKSCNFFQAAMK